MRLQSEPFDPGAEINAFLERRADAGALVCFTGTVRSDPDNPVETLTLEHHPGLAQTRIEAIATDAIERFALTDLGVIHRFGTLRRGAPIVLVMALAPHRQAAFDAAGYAMDYLKTDAPFWKKESGPEGEHWVEARAEDMSARERWKRRG